MTRRIQNPLVALVIAVVSLLAVASPAYAAAGKMLLQGSNWYGGQGVPVCNPSWTTCGGQAPVGSSGQCVELAQRFYKIRGWYSGIFSKVYAAAEIYNNAAANGWIRQADGSITSVVPGDMVVLGGGSTKTTYSDGTYAPAGHVAVVDSVGPDVGGMRTIRTVNQHVDPSVVRTDATWKNGHTSSPSPADSSPAVCQQPWLAAHIRLASRTATAFSCVLVHRWSENHASATRSRCRTINL